MLLNQKRLQREIARQAAEITEMRATTQLRWQTAGAELRHRATAPRTLLLTFAAGLAYGLVRDRMPAPGSLGLLLLRAAGLAPELLAQFTGRGAD